MPQAINLVCTRCTDKQHGTLQRWYNDHAQLLMASPLLLGVELFKIQSDSVPLDYFCLYHLNALSDFAAFDSGAVMAQVRELSNAAPGRSSIEIVKRTQYERVLHRRWASAPTCFQQAALLELPNADLAGCLRGLNDVLYQMHTEHALYAAQIYAAPMPTHAELFLLLESAAQELPADRWSRRSLFSEVGKMSVRWQASAQRIAQWLR